MFYSRSTTWMNAKTGELHIIEIKNQYGDRYDIYRTIMPHGSRYTDRFRHPRPRPQRLQTRRISGDADARQFWNLLCRQMTNHRHFIRLDR